MNPDLLLKLEFPSNPELLSVVRGAMERLTESMGFSERECRSVTRAVDEAVTNIIRHAYRGQPNQPIVLTCNRLSKAVGSELAQGLEIVVEDQGEAPDPGRLRGRSLDEIKPGGLGLHYIRESMDVVEFSNSGGTNQLRLVRCRGQKIRFRTHKGDTAMQISVRRTDKAAILELTGRIDLSSSAEVRKILLRELRESRTPRVILNLEKVKYIDSSGVASLVEGLKASRDSGSRLSLFGLSPIVREVLQLSRLLKMFEIFENEQQALSA